MPSSRYTGSFTKTIVVTSNDPEHANERLTCKGEVLQPIEANPRNVSFGRLKRGGPPEYRYITLGRGDGGPISPEVTLGALPGIDAQVCEVVPGEEYELAVWVGSPWPSGRIRDLLRLSTGVDEAPEITLHVSGETVPRLSAVPGTLAFPLERKEEIVRTTRLNWDDGKPSNVLEVVSSLPEAQVRLEQDGKTQKIVVTMPPGSDPVKGRANITVKTDDPASPEISIPMVFRSARERTFPQRRQSARPVVRP